MPDALIAVAAIALLVLPFFLLGLPRWGWLFLGIALVVAISEGLSYLKTRKTLSQKFWAFRKQHPYEAVALIALLALAWLGLLVHLLWR